MITGHQVRAARALLGWGGDRLAKETELNRDTIVNIEQGKVLPRLGSAEKILQVFNDHGVEFIGDRGVALMHDNYRILEGPDCYLRLLDEVYHTLSGKPDSEVLSICTDDSISPPEVVIAIDRWGSAGIKRRFLSHEDATRFDFPLEEYRLIPARYFKNSVMVIYANKVATLRGVNDAVLIVTDKDQADMLRRLFELIWEQSAKPEIQEEQEALFVTQASVVIRGA